MKARSILFAVCVALLALTRPSLAEIGDTYRVEPQFLIAGYNDSLPIQFHPTNPHLLLTVENHTIGLWDVSNPDQPRRLLTTAPNNVTCATFCQHGNETLIFAGHQNGDLSLLNLQGQTLKRFPAAPNASITAVTWSPIAKLLASADNESVVRLWKPDGTSHAKPIGDPDSFALIKTIAFAPKGDALAIAYNDPHGVIRFWNLDATPRPQIVKTQNAAVESFAFSSKGDFIVTGHPDGFIHSWNLDGSPHDKPFKPRINSIEAIVFRPNENIFAAADIFNVFFAKPDGTPYGLRMDNGEGLSPRLSFSPDGKILASTANGNHVRFWDRDGMPVGKPLDGFNFDQEIRDVAFSPKHSRFTVTTSEPRVQIWNFDATPHAGFKPDFEASLGAIVYSPDADLIAVGNNYRGLLVFNPDATLRTNSIKAQEYGKVDVIAFSPNGKLLATGDEVGTIRIWNRDGTPRGKLIKHEFCPATALLFSTDSDYLFSTSDDGNIHRWNLDGTPRAEPVEADGWSNALVFSPKVDTLISAGYDGVAFWTLEGNFKSYLLGSETGPVNSVLFSPDATRLIAGGPDGLRAWNAQTYRPLAANSMFTKRLIALNSQTLIALNSHSFTVLDWSFNIKAEAFITPQGVLIRTPEGYYAATDALKNQIVVYKNNKRLPPNEAAARNQPQKIIKALIGEKP